MDAENIKNKKIDQGCLYIVAVMMISLIIGGILDKVHSIAVNYQKVHKQEQPKDSSTIKQQIEAQRLLWNQKTIRSK